MSSRAVNSPVRLIIRRRAGGSLRDVHDAVALRRDRNRRPARGWIEPLARLQIDRDAHDRFIGGSGGRPAQ